MANTFGRLPGDGVTNSFGDVMPNVSLELYASEADATAQANSLGSVNTDGYGSWSFDADPTVNTLWVRDPGGGIHPTLPQSVSDAVAANASALAGKVGRGELPRFEAESYKNGANSDLDAIRAACQAATALTKGAVVQLSARTWDVGAGLSLSGYSCGLVGTGSSHDGTAANGTVLYASSQSGPVLNLDGWSPPGSLRGVVEFGGFAVRGSGVADATKANAGIKRTTSSISGVWFHDVVILETGGPCLDLFQLYVSWIDRVVCVTPAGAKANDVPYAIFRGSNGNHIDLGFRSLLASGDTGAGGALVVTDDGTYQSEYNTWSAWFEYLHVPTGGTLIHNAANNQVFDGIYFVDCSKESGATGTSFAQFAPSAFTNYGGNIWRGAVPGADPAATVGIDAGIAISQSNNRVVGTKGFKGTNVTLAVGVGGTFVELGGSISGATNAAVVDNSGQYTNVYIDHTVRTARMGRWSRDETGAFPGPRILGVDNPANGTVLLGNGGVRVESSGTNMYHTAGSVNFRDPSTLTASFAVYTSGNGGPAIKMYDSGALPGASASYRGQIRLVLGAAGVADRLVICRKDAADAYAWVDLV